MQGSYRGLCVDLLWSPSGWRSNACIDLAGGPTSAEGCLDLRGARSIALPGIIDMHVHLRGLELSYKEDESSGTLAALAGCVTAVVDMPNTRPFVRNPRALREKLRALSRSRVDYGLYAGVPESADYVEEMASAPIAGFKFYPEDLEKDEGLICSVLRSAERRGLLVIVHSEHPEMIRAPDYGYERDLHRSCAAEMLGIEEVRRLLKRCGAKPRVHITHVSCPKTLILSKQLGFSTDVTPHHLLFDRISFRHLWNPLCESKVNPPLRRPEERWGLWKLLMEGYVDAIASDHAPHAAAEKAWAPPDQCSPGFSSLESWPGALLLSFNAAGLLDEFVKLTSVNVQKILGISRGFTLSVFSLEPEASPGSLFSKAKITPYFGTRRARCLATIIRGRLTYRELEEGFGVNMFEDANKRGRTSPKDPPS